MDTQTQTQTQTHDGEEESHYNVLLAVRRLLVRATAEAQSSAEVEAVARLLVAYNSCNDWVRI